MTTRGPGGVSADSHVKEPPELYVVRTFAGVSAADKRKIVHDNAVGLYGFPAAAAEAAQG